MLQRNQLYFNTKNDFFFNYSQSKLPLETMMFGVHGQELQ